MEITSSIAVTDSPSTASPSTTTPASNAAANTANTANFAASLSDAAKLAERKEANFVSGRLGVSLNSDGIPSQVVYFNEQGEKLTASNFSAESILRNASQLGISLTDLRGLGTQLDAAGIGYKPYELYKGTGSDHGIDFDDLIAGGLGTAYDWTRDANAASKGPGALKGIEEANALARALNLTAHAAVTHNRGIDPAHFAAQSATSESPRRYVMFNGGVAAWYGSNEQALQASQAYGGTVTRLASPDSLAATASSITATTSSSTDSALAAGEALAPVTSLPASSLPSSVPSSLAPSSITTSSGNPDWNAQLQSLIESLRTSATGGTVNPLLQALDRLVKSN